MAMWSISSASAAIAMLFGVVACSERRSSAPATDPIAKSGPDERAFELAPRSDAKPAVAVVAEGPALTVTVDDVPQPAMPHGLAFSVTSASGEVTWYVDLSDRATTCDHYMGIDGRTLRDGDHTVGAFIGATGGAAVRIRNLVQTHEAVAIVGGTPRKVGDKLTLCIDHASFTGTLGTYEGQTIAMHGKLAGMYCGEKQ